MTDYHFNKLIRIIKQNMEKRYKEVVHEKECIETKES